MREMTAENMTDKCAHKICSCPARADTGYCGNYCMTASKDPDAGAVCGCGHPECKTGDEGGDETVGVELEGEGVCEHREGEDGMPGTNPPTNPHGGRVS